MREDQHRIGFVSTRFAGTDGVSLETAKWTDVLSRMGYSCFFFSGLNDRPAERSYVVPEAFYRHPEIDAITQTVFSSSWKIPSDHPEIGKLSTKNWNETFSVYTRPVEISKRIQFLKEHLKQHLYQFTNQFDLEMLIVENALSIPVNIPLGLALTEFIAETGYPVIAHHHDFHWERQRFMNNSVHDLLAAAFPARLPSIRHVVINSIQAQQLAFRSGLASMLIPNVMDFDTPPGLPDNYTDSIKDDLGVSPDQYLILQPTRVIPRKGIEHAIELTRRLGLPAALVISHASGDEGTAYEVRVKEFAHLLNVPTIFVSDIVDSSRGTTRDGRKIYSIADVYPQADLVTYPSAIEGFGNAFLEAVYYRRPIIVNNYSIYEADIKPKGFDVVEFDGFISDQTIKDVCNLLKHPELSIAQCEHNFELARRYYSYTTLEHHLQLLLTDIFGN